LDPSAAGKPVTCVTDIDDKMVGDIVYTGNKFTANFLQDSSDWSR
jgi:hypothetical protein